MSLKINVDVVVKSIDDPNISSDGVKYASLGLMYTNPTTGQISYYPPMIVPFDQVRGVSLGDPFVLSVNPPDPQPEKAHDDQPSEASSRSVSS